MISAGRPPEGERAGIFIFLLIIFLPVLIYSQERFRTGVYSNLSPSDDSRQNLQQIYEMGANTVISHSRLRSRDSLQTLFDSVIVFNAYSPQDYIHHYSSGYYTKWEAEEITVDTTIPGVKHQFGQNEDGHWFSGTESGNIGKLLVTGPDYVQDRVYKLIYNESPITYIVNFRMKIDGALTADSVCEVSVRYVTDNGAGNTIRSKILYASDLSNDFDIDTLHYILPERINGTAIDEGEVTFGAKRSYGSDAPHTQNYTGAYGVQFNVRWLGNRNLYIDYIEVYDQEIWKEYIQYPSIVTSEILAYAADSGTTNTSYWYALDEPHSIDSYQPYKTVQEILTQHGYPPLITCFYPGWDGRRNNEFSMKRYLDVVNPRN